EIRKSMFAAAEIAVKHIDMRKHKGVHPRIGAVDVVPLVPVCDVTIDECVEVSHSVGNDLASICVPVYFYEQSARIAARTKLPDLRRGGYEALALGPLEGSRLPDVGPDSAHPTAGATVVGARGRLVAYNIFLESVQVTLAKAIAKKLRTGESGLKGIKSIGLLLESRSQIQVSMNLTTPDQTPLAEVYAFIESEARAAGIEVVESEIIGAIRSRDLEGTTPEKIKAVHFKETQILENWMG
ncbi:MAG TPA: glutamate formimidoyltransferase, partial [Armatimonadota bacterium]